MVNFSAGLRRCSPQLELEETAHRIKKKQLETIYDIDINFDYI